MTETALCRSCGAPFEPGAWACRYCGASRPLTREEEAVKVFLETMELQLQRGKSQYNGRLVAAFALVILATVASYFALASIGTGFWSCLISAAGVFFIGFMSFGFYIERTERRALRDTYRLRVGPEMERFARERQMLSSDLQLHVTRLVPGNALLRKFLFGANPEP